MKLFLYLTTFCFTISLSLTTYAISENIASIVPPFIGTATGCLAGMAIKSSLKNEAIVTIPEKDHLIISGLATVCIGSISWILLDNFLQNQTPRGKLNKALHIITPIETESISMSRAKTIAVFFELLKKRFPGKTYLLDAAEFLELCNQNLLCAYELLHEVQEETSNPLIEGNSELARTSHSLEKKLLKLIETIALGKNIIIKSALYKNQLLIMQKALSSH